MSVLKVNGAVRLKCDGSIASKCSAFFIPRPKMVDLTVDKAQIAELNRELRRRADGRGWNTNIAATGIDRCPKHPRAEGV